MLSKHCIAAFVFLVLVNWNAETRGSITLRRAIGKSHFKRTDQSMLAWINQHPVSTMSLAQLPMGPHFCAMVLAFERLIFPLFDELDVQQTVILRITAAEPVNRAVVPFDHHAAPARVLPSGVSKRGNQIDSQ